MAKDNKKAGVVKDDGEFREVMIQLLTSSVSSDYAHHIADKIFKAVKEDVNECASEDWSLGDVAYGIGRVLMKKLRIEV